MVKNFALAYPEIKMSIIAFEQLKSINKHINTKRESEYMLRKRHVEILEITFKQTVSEDMQDKVWEYFYNKKPVAVYEKSIVDDEINKWLYCIAKEIGITTDF